MIRKIDFIFLAMMFLSGLGHAFGTFKFYEYGTDIFVWSLAGALAAFLVVAINVARRRHPVDRTIASLAVASSLAWIIVVGIFGQAIHNMMDPRVLMHAFSALGLFVISLRTLTASPGK